MRHWKRIALHYGAPLIRHANQLFDPLRRLAAAVQFASRLDHPVDPSVVVLSTPEIHGTGAIDLGCDLYLYRDLYMETRGAAGIQIGDGVVISRGTHLVAYEGIEIGEGSMIGEYASIRDSNHRTGQPAGIRYAGHTGKKISIGRNVWIGRGVTVLPGVTIGDGAVVGANAVVTADVAAGSIAVGVPARELRADRRAA